MVGFLFLYPAFVAKSHEKSGWEQLLILGLIGAAAAIGNFGGNYASARLQLGHPAQLVVRSTIAVTLVALATALTGKLMVAALAALVTSAASAIAKASLDASLQDDLPEESRASAFGRSESLLQLAWVAGGATGVLVYTQLHIGFTVISTMLILGLAQTLVSYRGDSLIPGLGGNRPVVAAQEGGTRWSGCPAGGAAGVKKGLAVLVAVVVLASVATGVLIWRLTRTPAPEHPEISAYTRGQLVRVGPYQFCDVLNPTDCETPRSDGVLAVDARNAVQLSVPPAIAAAPWVLVRSYEGSDVVNEFRSGSTLAVTIPDDGPAPRQAVRLRGAAADAGARRGGQRIPVDARRVVGAHRLALARSVPRGYPLAFPGRPRR